MDDDTGLGGGHVVGAFYVDAVPGKVCPLSLPQFLSSIKWPHSCGTKRERKGGRVTQGGVRFFNERFLSTDCVLGAELGAAGAAVDVTSSLPSGS